MIYLNLLRYQLRSKRRSLIYFSIGLFVYGFMITSIYPTISGMQAFSDYWDQFPQGIKNLFGGSEINILKPEGFMAMEYYQMILVIILSAFVMGFTAFCVAKARENGTIELILTQPLERWKYALSSFASFVLALTGLCTVAVATVILVSPIFGVDISYAGQLKELVLLLLLLLALGGISFFASCVLNSPGQVYAAGFTVLAVSYLVNYLANNWTFFRIFNHAFLYSYYEPYKVMTTPGFPWSSMVYYLAISIAFVALSLVALQRRDIII